MDRQLNVLDRLEKPDFWALQISHCEMDRRLNVPCQYQKPDFWVLKISHCEMLCLKSEILSGAKPCRFRVEQR
jgi:hypothetical protein